MPIQPKNYTKDAWESNFKPILLLGDGQFGEVVLYKINSPTLIEEYKARGLCGDNGLIGVKRAKNQENGVALEAEGSVATHLLDVCNDITNPKYNLAEGCTVDNEHLVITKLEGNKYDSADVQTYIDTLIAKSEAIPENINNLEVMTARTADVENINKNNRELFILSGSTNEFLANQAISDPTNPYLPIIAMQIRNSQYEAVSTLHDARVLHIDVAGRNFLMRKPMPNEINNGQIMNYASVISDYGHASKHEPTGEMQTNIGGQEVSIKWTSGETCNTNIADTYNDLHATRVVTLEMVGAITRPGEYKPWENETNEQSFNRNKQQGGMLEARMFHEGKQLSGANSTYQGMIECCMTHLLVSPDNNPEINDRANDRRHFEQSNEFFFKQIMIDFAKQPLTEDGIGTLVKSITMLRYLSTTNTFKESDLYIKSTSLINTIGDNLKINAAEDLKRYIMLNEAEWTHERKNTLTQLQSKLPIRMALEQTHARSTTAIISDSVYSTMPPLDTEKGQLEAILSDPTSTSETIASLLHKNPLLQSKASHIISDPLKQLGILSEQYKINPFEYSSSINDAIKILNKPNPDKQFPAQLAKTVGDLNADFVRAISINPNMSPKNIKSLLDDIAQNPIDMKNNGLINNFAIFINALTEKNIELTKKVLNGLDDSLINAIASAETLNHETVTLLGENKGAGKRLFDALPPTSKILTINAKSSDVHVKQATKLFRMLYSSNSEEKVKKASALLGKMNNNFIVRMMNNVDLTIEDISLLLKNIDANSVYSKYNSNLVRNATTLVNSLGKHPETDLNKLGINKLITTIAENGELDIDVLKLILVNNSTLKNDMMNCNLPISTINKIIEGYSGIESAPKDLLLTLNQKLWLQKYNPKTTNKNAIDHLVNLYNENVILQPNIINIINQISLSDLHYVASSICAVENGAGSLLNHLNESVANKLVTLLLSDKNSTQDQKDAIIIAAILGKNNPARRRAYINAVPPDDRVRILEKFAERRSPVSANNNRPANNSLKSDARLKTEQATRALRDLRLKQQENSNEKENITSNDPPRRTHQ